MFWNDRTKTAIDARSRRATAQPEVKLVTGPKLVTAYKWRKPKQGI